MNDLTTAAARPDAYELRIYDVTEGELESLLRELALSMMSDYGIEPVGSGRTRRVASSTRCHDTRAKRRRKTTGTAFTAIPGGDKGLTESVRITSS